MLDVTVMETIGRYVRGKYPLDAKDSREFLELGLTNPDAAIIVYRSVVGLSPEQSEELLGEAELSRQEHLENLLTWTKIAEGRKDNFLPDLSLLADFSVLPALLYAAKYCSSRGAYREAAFYFIMSAFSNNLYDGPWLENARSLYLSADAETKIMPPKPCLPCYNNANAMASEIYLSHDSYESYSPEDLNNLWDGLTVEYSELAGLLLARHFHAIHNQDMELAVYMKMADIGFSTGKGLLADAFFAKIGDVEQWLSICSAVSWREAAALDGYQPAMRSLARFYSKQKEENLSAFWTCFARISQLLSPWKIRLP